MTSKQTIYKLTGRNTPVRVRTGVFHVLERESFAWQCPCLNPVFCTPCKNVMICKIFFPLTKFSHIHLHWLNAICYNCTNIINILGKMAHSAYRL